MDGGTRSAGRPDRPAVSAPCRVQVAGLSATAQLADIGLGGLGLVVASQPELFEPDMPFQVSVEGLGVVEVECRWRRGNRIGAQFADEDAVQDQVRAFLAARGITLG